MKKLALILIALVCCAPAFAALQRAFYVKQGNTTTKYNFGVASDLKFSNGGRTLTVTGYNETIDLEAIDYITFSPEVDELALTPTAQKEKMVKIGEEAYSYVHLDRVAELLCMIDVFFNSDEIYDQENGTYDYPRCPFEYDIPSEYIDKHSLRKMLKGLADANNGNPAAIHSFRSAALKLYKASDYFGVYTANPETEAWEKTSEASYFEIRYLSKEKKYYSARLDCSSDFTTWTGEGTTIEVPKTITLTCKYEGKELAKAVIATTIAPNADMTMAVTSDVSGYHVVNQLDVKSDKMTDIVDITIDGEYYLHVENVIDGEELTDYVQIYHDIENSGERWSEVEQEYVSGDASALAAHFKRATVDIDLLKKLQVKGKMFNFSLMNDRFSKESDIYRIKVPGGYAYVAGKIVKYDKESGIMTINHHDTDIMQSNVDYLLDYSDFQFFYDGTPNIQGFLSWEMDDPFEENEEWTGEGSENYGYIDLNGYLVNVYKEYWNEENQEKNIKVWGYYVSGNNESGYNTVPEDAVILHPTMIRNYYHEVMPVLIFPDLSSYSFADFFTEVAFEKLINDYNEFIETYKNIVGIED